MAMTAQEYLDTFNAAINAGAYDSAANILKAAEGDFGPGVYDVAGVVLESNASLPPEIDFMTPQGIQSIRDYVNTATAPAPVASYGPPSPAVSPAVSNSISLTPAGIAALAPSANVSSPANVFSPADYGPPSPPSAAPPTASPAEIQRMQAQRAEAELLRLREAERPIVDPRPQPAVDPVAQNLLDRFNAFMGAGDFAGAANILKEGEGVYGGEVYNVASNYLNTDPRFAGLREQIGIGQKDTPAFNANNLRSFVDSQLATQAAPVTPVTPEGEAAPPTAQTTPGPGQIYGVPRFERQAQSNVPFAPLRRGLAQLRPAMYMPGLTSGQAPLGGSGFTPESLRNAIKSMTAAGQTPADVAYQMDIGGVSPAELSAAIGTPVGQIQAEYNQSRPRGLFSTGAPAPRGLPEDFVLQTGAYGAPTPTFLNRNATAAGGTAAGPAGVDQPTYAQLLDNVQRLSAQVQPLINRGQVDYGGGEVGFSQDPSGRGFFGDMEAAANAMGFGSDPSSAASSVGNDPSSAASSVGSDGGPSGDGPGDGPGGVKMGGLIRMAEGGGPPKMAELSAAKAGSTFDISKYIDNEGRLVGGMSKPIRDAYGKIIGYESGDLPLPIQRDVVFGKELRDKEAAMQLTDAEREQMMVEMAMRQGRTGISPTRGGVAGISADNLMPSYMRRQPQYYSPAEQFRPRYAEGGIASVAQNLADKGRKGDSMLVHMTPDEVAGLQALAQQMGGSLTINPQTGLPEANIFKKLLPMALGFALGPAGFGVFQSALTTGLAVGAGYTLATGSLQQGLAAGLGAYGGSNLGTGLQAAGTADAATSAAASDAASSGLQVAGGAGGAAAEAAMVNPMAHPDFAGTITPSGSSVFDLSPPANYSVAAPGAAEGVSLGTKSGFQASLPEVSSVSLTSADPTATSFETGLGGGVTPTAPPATPGSALTGAERYFGDKATSDLAAERYAARTGSTLGTSLMQTLGGATLQSAAEEQEAVKAQQAAIDEKREKRKRLAEEVARQTLGRVTVRSGGLMKLAGGGMSYMEAGGTTGPTGAPRDVVGNGDGMSDSVPADIEGVQEARLADGEFVIPADVVADIGNGSSDAGSKKLYDMMDRVRKARHGTTEQPPEIKAERLMPA
jgi:hypothetical protein